MAGQQPGRGIPGASQPRSHSPASRIPSFAATAALLLTLLVLGIGCGRRPPATVTDFSASNAVTVLLGDLETEHGHGLHHIHWEKDGRTSLTNWGDLPCRHLQRPDQETGYLYFAMDPSFKQGGVRQVEIEILYFDLHPGTLTLEYDASRSRKVPNPAYAAAERPVALTGSKAWRTAAFRVRDATFRNAQNSGADFRFCVSPAELYVRQVTVTRVRTASLASGLGLAGQDFSRSNRVSILLGDPEMETGHGLAHLDWEADGLTTATNLQGVPCRHLQLVAGATGYLYFVIDPTFKKGPVKQVTIEVEYLDPWPGVPGIQYDASRWKGIPNPAYAQASQTVPLIGSKTWQTATFRLDHARFKNAQNSGADFRLWVSPPNLYVRRVTVTRAAQ